MSRDQRGFWLDPAFQGQGLMTEAADRVTDYAFRELGWPCLWLSNAQDNHASRRIKEKQGARLVDLHDRPVRQRRGHADGLAARRARTGWPAGGLASSGTAAAISMEAAPLQ